MVVKIMNSCFIHDSAPLLNNVKLAQKMNSRRKQRYTLSTPNQLHYLKKFQVETVSVTIDYKIQIICISLVTYFSPTVVYCPFLAGSFLFGVNFFHILAIIVFQLQLE